MALLRCVPDLELKITNTIIRRDPVLRSSAWLRRRASLPLAAGAMPSPQGGLPHALLLPREKAEMRPSEGAFVSYGVSSVLEYLERATECSGARTKATEQERQSRRPPCFIRSETRLRGAPVVYHQSKRRLDLTRRGNDRYTGSRWLLLFFRVYGKRFQRSQELPTRVSDAPTAIIPQHKRIGKNFELWCARGQPPHPIGPIRSA
jgi:hypothetical protein